MQYKVMQCNSVYCKKHGWSTAVFSRIPEAWVESFSHENQMKTNILYKGNPICTFRGNYFELLANTVILILIYIYMFYHFVFVLLHSPIKL